jgi:hypothetical protein
VWQATQVSAELPRPVLSAFVAWHPGAAHAGDLASAMFKELCADPDFPARRGLGMPVRFRTAYGVDELPAAVPFGRSRRTVVFVLVDDLLAASTGWRDYCARLVSDAGELDRIVPVALTDCSNLPPAMSDLEAIRLDRAPTELHEDVLMRDAMHDLCRCLDPEGAKVKVFLSHAKQDGLEIARTVRAHLRDEDRLDDFFDAADVPDGVRFGDFIMASEGSAHALLAIQTDTYGSREWCRMEVLEAKKRRMPIVVLAAVERGETRSFPYIGNVPVIRWRGPKTAAAVAGGVLREVLRTRYFPRRMESLCRLHGLDADRQVLAYPPELLTALAFRSADAAAVSGNLVLYPDPPLGTEELAVLAELDPNLRPVTPTGLLTG